MSFAPKHEDDQDAFKQSGSEEDDVGYHSIGRNIKVIISGFTNCFKWHFQLEFKALSSSAALD